MNKETMIALRNKLEHIEHNYYGTELESTIEEALALTKPKWQLRISLDSEKRQENSHVIFKAYTSEECLAFFNSMWLKSVTWWIVEEVKC